MREDEQRPFSFWALAAAAAAARVAARAEVDGSIRVLCHFVTLNRNRYHMCNGLCLGFRVFCGQKFFNDFFFLWTSNVDAHAR